MTTTTVTTTMVKTTAMKLRALVHFLFCYLLLFAVPVHTNPLLCTSNSVRQEKILLLRKENLLHYFYMSCSMNTICITRVWASARNEHTAMPNKSPKIQQHYCRNMTLMHVAFFLHKILWMNFFYYSNYVARFVWVCVCACRFLSSCVAFSVFSSLPVIFCLLFRSLVVDKI